MSVTIQKILAARGEGFFKAYRLPGHQRRACWCLSNCRTPVMGQHVQRCCNGHVQAVHYNSCKHRCCPNCSWMKTERWLQKQREQLLQCAHFHVIFTLPQELHPLWRYNYRRFGNLLFQAASQSLLQLLADPKYLGARPGLIAALHTWTKQLTLHPHLHVLVTDGGLNEQGDWQRGKGRYLLPFRVLMAKFRGKLRALILASLNDGLLRIPPSTTELQLRNLLNRLGRQTWNVKILERYDHGVGVAVYLARYLRGGPISNQRLLSHSGGLVRFRYLNRRDAANPQQQVAALGEDQFLLRYLQHVPPKCFMMLRRYGLYANAGSGCYEQARRQLDMSPREPAQPPGYAELLQSMGIAAATTCSICGCALSWHRISAISFRPIRSPPLAV